MPEAEILARYCSVAIVGASPDPERPSYQVAQYLMEHGYRVFFVNPRVPEIMGQPSFPSLAAVPDRVEVVDIFRRPNEVMPLVLEAIEIGARAIWMQVGVVNEAAAAKAREAGLDVVMDRCMAVEHEKLIGGS
jgi:predicted CoA-binding protein